VKRGAKIVLAIIGLVVVAVASLPFLLNANTFRPAIEMQLTVALGRSVKLGDLRLSLLSGSLVAKDLSVADDSNISVALFLIAKELRIGVLLRPFNFLAQGELGEFRDHFAANHLDSCAQWHVEFFQHWTCCPSGCPC
jgi:AsmA protein